MSEGFVHRLLRDIGRAEVRAVNEEERMKFTVEELEEIGRQVMAADEQAEREERMSNVPVAEAVEAIGRALTAMDNEWDDGGDEPMFLTVRSGKHRGSWDVTVTGDTGWAVDAVVTVNVVEARKGEA